MEAEQFIQGVCRQLVREISANDDVLGITSNSDLKGAFAEASIHQFLRRFVAPLRVSRGAILYEGNCGARVPELDAIVWQPSPLPPVLEAGDFAFIPRTSGLAFLEIKRSNYKGVGRQMREHLDLEEELVPLVEGTGAWNATPARAFGVVCVHDTGARDADLEELYRTGRAVALLRRATPGGEYCPDPAGILRLAEFLMGVRRRALVIDGRILAKLPSSSPAARPLAPNVQAIAPTSGFVT